MQMLKENKMTMMVTSKLGDLSSKDKIRFRSNEKMVVMSISTSESSIGNVLTCNNEIKNFLGYDKKEIIGHKINKIIPKVYN